MALLPGDRAPVETLGLSWSPRVVAFVRPLGCPAAQASLARLRGQDGLVVVTPSRDGLDVDAIVDGDGALARAWRIGRDRRFLCTLRGLRAHPIAATLRVMRHGDALMSIFELDGDLIVAARHACHVADLP